MFRPRNPPFHIADCPIRGLIPLPPTRGTNGLAALGFSRAHDLPRKHIGSRSLRPGDATLGSGRSVPRRAVRDEGVAGSNPATPTKQNQRLSCGHGRSTLNRARSIRTANGGFCTTDRRVSALRLQRERVRPRGSTLATKWSRLIHRAGSRSFRFPARLPDPNHQGACALSAWRRRRKSQRLHAPRQSGRLRPRDRSDSRPSYWPISQWPVD